MYLTHASNLALFQTDNRLSWTDLSWRAGLLAATCAAKVLGSDHSATKALTRASITMDRVDIWRARLALKTLRRVHHRAARSDLCILRAPAGSDGLAAGP